ALRELAALAPYDTLCVLANTRKYGGGGIFNLWSTCASDTSQAGYIFVHEFGHSFAGLADEYYTSKVAYENFTPPGVEPWEPNITALLDPRRLKWSDLVEASFPVPTPWNQEAYDKASRAYQERRRSLRRQGAAEAELDALFAEIKRTTGDLMRAERHRDRVGAFEGAGYQAKGLYRSEVDCIMFSRNRAGFCKVCSRAIERVIRLTSE
ncbi:MAG: M64 family metallo-endopeptidase, partial [Planctomycetota bacterium]|nr:M64 family metallo-endopeptidase [Planctomycetota bacterium]